jgi:hypothetical protein
MAVSLFCFPSVGIIALAYLFLNESLTDTNHIMYFTAERLLLIINISCSLLLPSQTIIDYVVFIVLQAGLLYFSPLKSSCLLITFPYNAITM